MVVVTYINTSIDVKKLHDHPVDINKITEIFPHNILEEIAGKNRHLRAFLNYYYYYFFLIFGLIWDQKG